MTAPAAGRARPAAAVPAGQRGAAGEFTGTGRLLRLALRRDRIRIPAWALLFAGLGSASYNAVAGLYPDPASWRTAAEVMNSAPSLVAMFGRIYDPNSLGSVATIKLTTFYGAAISILAVFHVVRHTRADEDAGRVELLNSAVVGRSAPLAAALLDLLVLAAAIGGAVAVAYVAAGAPASGSLAFGLAWALMALVYGTFTATMAQVSPEARPTVALGVAAVGLGYLLRGIGDMSSAGPGVASWMSPIGWGQQIRPFAGDRYLVALLPLLASAGLAVLAIRLRERRDLGSGMVAERPGPAGTSMASPVALALRLNRGLLIGWAGGLLVLGLVIGSVADSMGGFFDDPATVELLAKLGGRKAVVDMFLSAELGLISLFTAAIGISVISHLRREEENGRTEFVLAGPTSRRGWLAGSLLVALGGTTVLLILLGLGVGAGAALALGDFGQVGRLVVAAAVRAPAAWVVTGIAVVFYGFAPRLVPATWVALLAFLALGDFARLWGLPQWVSDLSPFTHSPNLPGEHLAVLPLVTLTLVAGLLSAAGMAGWVRRDLLSA